MPTPGGETLHVAMGWPGFSLSNCKKQNGNLFHLSTSYRRKVHGIKKGISYPAAVCASASVDIGFFCLD